MGKIKDEVIDVSEVVVAPRGRKANLDADLTEAFRTLPIDKAVKLTGKFGSVAPEDRQKVGATIRKNWRAVRTDNCRVNYGKDGVPQVAAKPATEAVEA
jgi:hypothetical protein